MSQPNPSTNRKMKLDSTENMDEQSDLASTCLKLFGFGNQRGLRQSITRLLPVISVPATSLYSLAPPYSQKQITILTMFQHVCFSFGLRAEPQSEFNTFRVVYILNITFTLLENSGSFHGPKSKLYAPLCHLLRCSLAHFDGYLDSRKKSPILPPCFKVKFQCFN